MSTQQTIELLKAMKPTQLAEDIAKSFQQSTGLVAYDLEPAAKTLYPVLTPLRNIIPRVKANGGTATNWKQIIAINPSNMRAGVSEGNRGAAIQDAVQDRTAAYRGMGLENFLTYEADYASEGFDDARARASQSLLNSLMIREEQMILGANNSLALGTTPTPAVVASGTGGTLATQTLSVICVALTHSAWRFGSVANGLALNLVRTNQDGSTDTIRSGLAQRSAAGTAAVTGPTGSATATVAMVNGAVGYAWFAGAGGSERLVAITALNTVSITALNGASQLASALPATDDSRETLEFDGLLTQIMTPGSGSVILDLPTVAGVGTPFTTDGAGGIVEIDAMCGSFWDNSRLSPDVIWLSGRTHQALSRLIVANGGAPLVRFDSNSGGNDITSGTRVKFYLNKITGKQMEFVVHPDMPDGQLFFWSNSVPYLVANIANLVQMKMRQEYYQVEWPRRTRRFEFGVYADGLLQMYFTPAFGLLRNARV